MSNRIGEKLSEIRLRRGWKNREEAALVLGWSANALGNYERGERQPPLDFLADFAEKTNTDVWVLVSLCLEDLGKGRSLQDTAAEYTVTDATDTAAHARRSLLAVQDFPRPWCLAIMEMAARGEISPAGVDRLIGFISSHPDET